jgi:hypothetical protein
MGFMFFLISNHLTRYTLNRNLRDTARKPFQKQERSFQNLATLYARYTKIIMLNKANSDRNRHENP